MHCVKQYSLLSIIAFLLALVVVPSSAYAQNQTSTEVEVSYSSSYETDEPSVITPVTVGLEYHLYNPGDEVMVRGSVLDDLVEQIDNLDLIEVELKDGDENVVARQNATVENGGNYSTTLNIPDNTQPGTYTVESRAEVDADALGIVEAITSATLRSSIEFVIEEPTEYSVNAEGEDFQVIIASNSEVEGFEFNQQERKIAFSVDGDDGTTGVTEITIPKDLLSGEMRVFIDENLVPEEDVIIKSETDAETTFEINYTHSIHSMEVTGTNVIPEFPIVAAIMAVAISVIIGITVLGRTRGFMGGLWSN